MKATLGTTSGRRQTVITKNEAAQKISREVRLILAQAGHIVVTRNGCEEIVDPRNHTSHGFIRSSPFQIVFSEEPYGSIY